MATNQNDVVAASSTQQQAGAQLVGGNGNDVLLASGTQTWTGTLTAENNSGVSGTVTATLNGSQLQVQVQAAGLEPNQVHPAHIHGLTTADGAPVDSHLATTVQDTDLDGFVELSEGRTVQGPPILNLTIDSGRFPTAAADGTLNFTSTVDLSQLPHDELAKLFPLDLRTVELHGLTTTAQDGTLTGGEVDGTAGYKVALPVAGAEMVSSGGTAGGAAVLRGDNGGDTLVGADGNDLLLGGQGSDILDGQAGNDQLVGGSGRDVFIVGQGNDLVVDFEQGVDKLELANNQSSAAVQVSAVEGGTLLTSGDATITLMGVNPSVAAANVHDWFVA